MAIGVADNGEPLSPRHVRGLFDQRPAGRVDTAVTGLAEQAAAVAALLGLLLLNEHLTVLQWAAIACTMAAAVGSAGTARRG